MEHNKIVTSLVKVRFQCSRFVPFYRNHHQNILPLLLIGAELSGRDGSFYAP